MFFVGIDYKGENVARVRMRAALGGHYIPEEDILRRSKSIMKNLIENIQLFDFLYVVNNDFEYLRVVIQREASKLIYCSEELPSWCNELAEVLRKIEK
ncbi:hypothetical protein [Bacillus sp. Brlt_9]|uniref:hypothetical protein n=1 Tax=Bacillus sp. Brlt_9 TaxID=3110916 RepID=UPI003F7CBEFC